MTAPPDDAQSTETKPRLLLIDDSKVMRKSAVKMLGKDFDVVVAEDGREGWKKILEDDAIQVVFTDLNMPNLNGYELLQLIRTSEDDGVRNLPVIVVTGAENDDEAKEQAYDKGATDFITKPFNSTDLRARAQAHADYHRKTQALEVNNKVDALTQLGNEQHFRERLAQDVSFVSRHKEDLAVMVVELNDFNGLFLKIGRVGADSVIKQIAKVLLKAVRKEDTVSRLGLARFAVSLPTAKSEGAVQLAKRICAVVDSFKAKLRGEALSISVSIGVYIPAYGSRPTYDDVWNGAKEALGEALKMGCGEVFSIRAEATEEDVEPELEAVLEPAAGAMDAISIDKALLQLKAGESDIVALKIPVLLQRLDPIFKLLNDPQKQALIKSLNREV
ncbi:MAG: response regulator [Pseudomonadales bacterium]|nr:response regulator [Pseudomonadales bacterium]